MMTTLSSPRTCPGDGVVVYVISSTPRAKAQVVCSQATIILHQARFCRISERQGRISEFRGVCAGHGKRTGDERHQSAKQVTCRA